MAELINAFQMAQAQFGPCGRAVEPRPAVAEILRWPSREFKFMIPTRMDDGSMRLFFGYRVQHNDAAAHPRAASAFIR